MKDRASDPKQNFNRLYGDVAKSLATATAEIDKLEVDHKTGKQEIGNILERLRNMQEGFESELGLLEEHAEWEKFTIAFFGETNAGKSTIIESLRILFKEESRQQLLDQNAGDLSRYEAELTGHVDVLRRSLLQAHADYAADIAALRGDIEAQSSDLLEESAARTAAIRVEVDVLERSLQEETSTREQLKLSLEETKIRCEQLTTKLEKVKRKVWLALVAGCVLGSAAIGIISLALK
jgi:tRNA U34 5-carboxymethylaminomethyl modifying GTPase MnmE/TrmE